jgi:acyl-CoA thioester hydrolase
LNIPGAGRKVSRLFSMGGRMTASAAWIECGRSSVQTWECDQMGHMNVQFYVQRAEDAAAFLAQAIGLGPAAAREANARLTPRQQHMRFHRELRPGAPYWVRGAPVYVGEDAVAFTFEMLSSVNDSVVFALTGYYQWADVTTRATLDMPDAVKARARAMVQDIPETALERGLTLHKPRPSPTVREAEAMGLAVTFRGEVLSEQCDAEGFLRVRDHIGRVSDAIPNLLARTSGTDRSLAGSRTGGAALEYRFVYRSPARAGDLISVRSGLVSLSEKSYVWAHWLADETTGVVFASAEAVAVAMDLDARKAIPIPASQRAVLEKHLIAGLTC